MADDIKQIEEKLNKLKASLDKVGQKALERIIAALKSGGAGLDEWNDQLATFQDKVDKVNSSLSYVAQSFKDSVNELSRQNKYLTSSRSIISKISTTAREVLSARRGETSLDEKSVKLAQEKIKSQREELKQAKESGNLTQAQQKEIQSVIDSLDDYEKGLKGALKTHKEINKQLGIIPQVFGGLDKGLSKLGMSGLGISEALSKTQKLGQEAASLGDKEFKKFSASKTFFKELGSNFSEIASKANIIQFVIVGLIDGFMSADKQSGELAKTLGITYDTASNLRKEFAAVANTSLDSNVTVKGLQESLAAVNTELGTSARISTEELTLMTKLNKQAGISLETQAKLRTTAVATGETYKNFVKSFQDSAKSAKFQAGIALDTKKLMTDMVNVSNRTKLSIEGGAAGLAKAAVAAKVMGSDLEKVAAISDKLLNFEQSIEAELSAELLTGKDINLEKARQAALNNDLATVAEEITKQAGSAAEFSKMNRLQQEAMADAVGMTADQLADTLVEQEALKSIGRDLNEEEQAAFEAAKAKHGVEKASAMLKKDGIGDLLKEQSNQEKFTATIEKLKEIFTQVGDALMPIFTMLADIATTIMPVINFLLAPLIEGFRLIGNLVKGFVKGLKEGQPLMVALAAGLTAMLAPTLMTAIFSIFRAFSMIPFGLGIPLAIKTVAGMISLATQAKTANDLMSAPPGYGKRTLLGPEGAIQLNDKDTVIAGTNLFGNDVKSEPGKATQMGKKGEIKLGGDSSAVVNAIMELRKDVNALANRPINVQIDGKNVTKAIYSNPNTVGDESRTKAYKIF